MGRAGWPDFHKKLGDSIEDAKKAIAKIETNKYSGKDVICLASANAAILQYLVSEMSNENINKE